MLLLHQPQQAADKAKVLLDKFRADGKEIIHVQHEFSEYKEINATVAPLAGEKIVRKKYPSAFLDTDLADYLAAHDIKKLVVAGMMSHMCVDTTVRACQNYGHDVIVVEDACTTKDLVFQSRQLDAVTVHEVFMAGLDGMFAEVMSLKNYLQK